MKVDSPPLYNSVKVENEQCLKIKIIAVLKIAKPKSRHQVQPFPNKVSVTHGQVNPLYYRFPFVL